MGKNRKKKLYLSIVIILVITIIVVILFNRDRAIDIEKKASKIWGDEYCPRGPHPSNLDIVQYKCPLCKKEYTGTSSYHGMCQECANQTNRCASCGKKIN